MQVQGFSGLLLPPFLGDAHLLVPEQNSQSNSSLVTTLSLNSQSNYLLVTSSSWNSQSYISLLDGILLLLLKRIVRARICKRLWNPRIVPWIDSTRLRIDSWAPQKVYKYGLRLLLFNIRSLLGTSVK